MEDVIAFYTAEADRCHELMDGAVVPRQNDDGETLSLSQRVEALTRLLAGMTNLALRRIS